MSTEAASRARERFEAGDHAGAHEAAVAALADSPDDVELLLLAGRAAVELDRPDAVDHLQKATELAPEDADAWLELGDALATEGRTEDAQSAFKRVVELRPNDPVALSQLGHSTAALGDTDSAMSVLAEAAEADHRGDSTASISLVEMYRLAGRLEDALVQARRIREAQPDDVLSVLDVAELALSLDQLDEAEGAYATLRDIDDDADHDVYALHGLIEVEMKRGNDARALELAQEASAIDKYGLTAELINFLESRGQSAAQNEIEGLFATSGREHRRAHLDDRRLAG